MNRVPDDKAEERRRQNHSTMWSTCLAPTTSGKAAPLLQRLPDADSATLPHGTDPLLFLIGDGRQPDFAGLTTWMSGHYDVHQSLDLSGAIATVDTFCVVPDLIVLLQARSGVWKTSELISLKNRLPIVPIVSVIGSWGEGETRSGAPLEGVTRLYWHQAQAAFSAARQQLARGVRSWWDLPATAEFCERQQRDENSNRLPKELHVGVAAAARQLADPWLTTISAAGAQGVWIDPRQPPPHPLDVIVWDDAVLPRRPPQDLARLVSLAKSTPVVALMNFPRIQDVTAAAGMGVAGVMGKPLDNEFLFATLVALAASQGEVESCSTSGRVRGV